MTKIVTLISILIFCNSLLAQDTISGNGYILTGLQRQANGEWLNFYRLAYPKQHGEIAFFDSIYTKALVSKNHRFIIGKSGADIISFIDAKNSYNLLACKGVSNKDSFIIKNQLSYDIGNCAQMRISRPFSANVSPNIFDNSGYVLHIDKVKFDGYVVELDSLDLYNKLMSYRMEDRDGKLLCIIPQRKITARLSIKFFEYQRFTVFVPRQLRIFDKKYYPIEPNCFENTDN